eukprot:GFYU01014972.1.p1 GENE.GFYU01014972.1~~GFYU01014972.1.p1  ORF type:complete len:299 (+),score=25.10 GFYU01014972.1:119-898(+)
MAATTTRRSPRRVASGSRSADNSDVTVPPAAGSAFAKDTLSEPIVSPRGSGRTTPQQQPVTSSNHLSADTAGSRPHTDVASDSGRDVAAAHVAVDGLTVLDQSNTVQQPATVLEMAANVKTTTSTHTHSMSHSSTTRTHTQNMQQSDTHTSVNVNSIQNGQNKTATIGQSHTRVSGTRTPPRREVSPPVSPRVHTQVHEPQPLEYSTNEQLRENLLHQAPVSSVSSTTNGQSTHYQHQHTHTHTRRTKHQREGEREHRK